MPGLIDGAGENHVRWARGKVDMPVVIRIKRVYDKSAKDDGVRVLVDRLWPRGKSKEDARVDLWLKEIAPSDDLRKWYRHDASEWDEFQKRYAAEIESQLPLLRRVLEYLEREHGTVTFVYSAKDEERNNAVALKSML